MFKLVIANPDRINLNTCSKCSDLTFLGLFQIVNLIFLSLENF